MAFMDTLKGLLGRARAGAEDAAEAAKPYVAKARDAAADAAEAAKPYVIKAKETAADVTARARQNVDETADLNQESVDGRDDEPTSTG